MCKFLQIICPGPIIIIVVCFFSTATMRNAGLQRILVFGKKYVFLLYLFVCYFLMRPFRNQNDKCKMRPCVSKPMAQIDVIFPIYFPDPPPPPPFPLGTILILRHQNIAYFGLLIIILSSRPISHLPRQCHHLLTFEPLAPN